MIFLRWGWLSLGLFAPIAVIPVIWGGYSDGLTLFITPLAIGSVAGWILKKGMALDRFLITSVLLFSFLFTAEYHTIRNFRDYDMLKVARDNAILVLDKSEKELDKIFDQYKTSEKDRKVLRGEFKNTVAMLKQNKWLQLFRDMLPFISFLYALLTASLSFFLIRKFFSKNFSVRSKALEYFRLNDYAIFALISGWAGVIFLDKAAYPVLSIVSLNTALISSVLYIVQALGVVKFKMLMRGWPMYILPLAVFTTFFLGSSAVIFITIILTGIGTLDLWADFRKLIPKNEQQGE